jgi:DeoR family transcriptional regulator, fructose operon transcriptional repressor
VYPEERRRAITLRAQRDGRVEVTALAAELAVTPETVRRDLNALESQGVLRRVHGGAIAVERLRVEPTVSDRSRRRRAEKARIARRALDFVPASGTIGMDAGTTTGALAELLAEDGRELTVLTNDIRIASQLAPHPTSRVLLAGGRVRARTLATVDADAAVFLRRFRPDITFVATNGVSSGAGVTTPDPSEAAAKRALIDAARFVVLLADHTKVGDQHFSHVASIDEVDLLITDDGVDDAARKQLEHAGLEVVVA